MNMFSTDREDELHFPITLRMKLMALAPQFYVSDKNDRPIAYVKQKLFKLKEDISIFANEQQNKLLYTIKADRIIDFNAVYTLRDAAGQTIGKLKREGMRSLWRTSYTLLDAAERPAFTIKEANPWVALADGTLSEIPIIGMFTGYFLNPTYLVTDTQGREAFRLRKEMSLMERKFSLNKTGQATPEQETLVVLGLMMLLLQERGDG